LSTFLYREIGKKLGMSFDEYLNHTRYELEAIHRILETVDAKRMKANEAVMSELEGNNKKNAKPPTG
jgi:hypothetical protein